MPTRATPATTAPARTHQQAVELFRRPFAPGAIGFRAMTKVAYNGDPWGGAQVAAYLNAQSVIQRLNCVVPGRWRQEFGPLEGDLLAASADGDRRSRLYLACRLIVTLPIKPERTRRRRRLRGRRRARRRLARRPEGALLRRPQARRRRRRDRRLPLHRARRRRAADRPAARGRSRSPAAPARATCSPSRPRPSNGCATATARA